MRKLHRYAIIAALVLASGVARADGKADFEKGRAAFLGRNWADAEEKLRAALDPKNGLRDRSLISQSRMYLGAALLQQGKLDDAKNVFEQLVLDDPQFEPDPLGYPGPAIDTYIDVRSGMLEQIRKAQQTAAQLAAEKKARDDAERDAQRIWLEKVKAQAQETDVTVKHSRVVASLPFGAGQFQNGQPALGWAFAGVEGALAIGSVITLGMYRYAIGRRNDTVTGTNQLSGQWNDRANDIRLTDLGLCIGLVGVAAIGVLQAHLAFVPESAETRQRPLPPAEPVRETPRSSSVTGSIAPIVSPLQTRNGVDGVFLGAAARF